MPKLWTTTIETHRQEVRSAVVGSAASLMAERGLSGLTMSAIATRAGLGRATLYKYFQDVDSILNAWHEHQVAAHVAYLGVIAEGGGTAVERLKRVLLAYAEIRQRANCHAQATDVAAALHNSPDLGQGHDALSTLLEGLIDQGVADGDVRDDVASAELATFVLAALNGAGVARSRAAAVRLVHVTLDGLTSSH